MARRTWIAALALSLVSGAGLVATATDSATAKAKKPPRPVVTKVDPRTGSTLGGTVVTIKGKHLKTATKVLFGKSKGTKLKVKSDKKLTVVAPPHAEGVVDVKVKTKGGASAKGPTAKFTYTATKASVTAVSPATGPTTGGTRVSITGSGFVGVKSVTFDGIPGTALSVTSPTQLQVTSPAHHAGLIHVNVTNAAGTSPSKNGDLFRYVSSPRSVTAPVPADASSNPATILAAVSCAPGDFCVAVGSYRAGAGVGVHRPLVERRTGTDSWVASSPALPADADPVDPEADLVDVSCPTSTFCAAVGSYKLAGGGSTYKPMVTTWNGTAWSQAQSVSTPAGGSPGSDAVVSIDCASSTTCVAVGSDYTGAVHRGLVLTMAGNGTWTSQNVVIPATPGSSDVQLADVSCVSATSCAAVGSGQLAVPTQHKAVVAVLSGNTWTATNPTMPDSANSLAPQASLESVSCTEAAACTAAGRYLRAEGYYLGMVKQWNGSIWTARYAGAPAGAAADPDVHLTSVSCASGMICQAVGDYQSAGGQTLPLTVATSATGVAPTAGPLPAGPTPDGQLAAVTCPAATSCAAVGLFQPSGGVRVPLLLSLLNTGWVAAAGSVPAGWVDGALQAVAADDYAAVGVGTYSTAGSNQGVITVDIPRG